MYAECHTLHVWGLSVLAKGIYKQVVNIINVQYSQLISKVVILLNFDSMFFGNSCIVHSTQ